MRFNEKELAEFAARKTGQLSGRLQYTQCKATAGGYMKNANFRDRYCKLIGNLLYYYRINELGVIDSSEPAGVLVLVNYSIQPESDVDLSFGFAIVFLDEPDKKHIFTARTDEDVQLWINTLQSSSYQHWSDLYRQNQNRIRKIQTSVTLPLKEAIGGVNFAATNVASDQSEDTPLILFDPLAALKPSSSTISNVSVPMKPSSQPTGSDDLIKL